MKSPSRTLNKAAAKAQLPDWAAQKPQAINPRPRSIGSILASRPRKALKAAPGSTLSPRL
jgi:hypothetical protein